MQAIENELKGIDKRFKWFAESIEDAKKKKLFNVIDILLNEMEDMVDKKRKLITRLGEKNESSRSNR